MYIKTPRDPAGKFKAAKKLLEQAGKCSPPVVPVIVAAAAAVAIWEGAKALFGD